MDLITPDFGVIFWQSIILLTVILVLKKFAWGPIISFLQQREDAINSSLEKAEQANQFVKELEQQKSTLLVEVAVEKNRIIAEAVSAKNSVIAKARLEADLMTSQAIERNRKEIEEEQRIAKIALKEEMAYMAIQLAERLLKNEISSKEQSNKLLSELLKQTSV